MPFYAAIPAVIVVFAIGIVPPISFIVFFIVAIKIFEREPIVTGDKIHRSVITSRRHGVDIVGPCDTRTRRIGKP